MVVDGGMLFSLFHRGHQIEHLLADPHNRSSDGVLFNRFKNLMSLVELVLQLFDLFMQPINFTARVRQLSL